MLSVVLFAAGGWLGAWLLTAFLGLEAMSATAVGLAAGVAVFLVLLRWPGRRSRVQQHDYIHGRVRISIPASIDLPRRWSRVHAKARWTKSCLSATASARCSCSMFVSARLRATPISAVAASLALHPRAQGVRRTIARIVAQPSIGWTEYQSRADTISFYKFDQGQAAGARRCTLATAARRGRFTFSALPWSVATRPRAACLRHAWASALAALGAWVS